MSLCVSIIEPRPLTNKINLLIKNVRDTLGDVPVFIFCGKSSIDRIEKDDNIELIKLEKDNYTSIEYCNLCKSDKFWDYISTDKILFMQTDGCLCTKSKYSIENFYHYDYIGGYASQSWWTKELRIANIKDNFKYQCLNGGFSLRNVEACKNALKEFKPKQTIDYRKYTRNTKLADLFEDLFFACAMHVLGYNIAQDYYSINFCTHTEYIKDTFCVHNLFKYKKDSSFLEYCPEYIDFVSA